MLYNIQLIFNVPEELAFIIKYVRLHLQKQLNICTVYISRSSHLRLAFGI